MDAPNNPVTIAAQLKAPAQARNGKARIPPPCITHTKVCSTLITISLRPDAATATC